MISEKVISVTPQSQLQMGDREKLSVTFSHTWLILVELNQFFQLNESNTKWGNHECLELE